MTDPTLKIPISIKPKLKLIVPTYKKPQNIALAKKEIITSSATNSPNTSLPKEVVSASNSLENKEGDEQLHPLAVAAIATTLKQHEQICLLKSKTFDVNNENLLLIDQFKLLVTQIEHQMRSAATADERKKHGFRLASIKKAIDVFEQYPGKISSGYEAKKVDGIGVKIAARIDEILKTGTLAELTEKKFATDYTEKVKQLCGVTGIGEVRARDLINKYDLQGVDDLIKRWKAGEIKVGKNDLTHHMEVGLRWYHDIKQKIPRSEMDEYSSILSEKVGLLDPFLKVQVCGSYRRGRPFSGDIDVLLTHPRLMTHQDIEKCPVNYLLLLVDGLIGAGIIVDSLTDKGETKYMGVARLSPNSVGRRIDIRFVAYECWAAAVLYFTGSWHFNKIFRGIALQRGYTVNEYGIYRLNQKGEKGELIPTFSEKQIFAIVGVQYLTPAEREM
jgi:DNA polymerase beta